MEVLDSMMLKSSTCSYTHLRKPYENSKSSSLSNSKVCFMRGNQIPSLGKFGLKAGNSGFDDKGHLEYYSRGSPVCGERKEKGKGKGKKGWNGIPAKKKMKLLKGLVEDLSTFSDLGYGLELGCDDNNQGFVADNDKSLIISQAADTLLAQLKQLRAEEEEEQMKKCKSQGCESSSSSSESSDSECDEVIDMKSVKNKNVAQPIVTPEIHSVNEEPSSTTPCTLKEQSVIEQLSQSSEQKCCNMILDMTLNSEAGIEVLDVNTPNLYQSKVGSTGKKIEVCMGGKCKKSGAPALMEEFQRVMGDEGVVEGCKCMGKCKSAPNVKVLNADAVDNSLKAPSNSLCIGVGLEDVELIVANYLGEESSKDQLHVAVAAA